MSHAESVRSSTEQDKQHVYFVDQIEYKSEHSTLTGAQIKARIPDYNATYALFLEAPGNNPDRLIKDGDSVSLDSRDGPLHFCTVPPATFGEE